MNNLNNPPNWNIRPNDDGGDGSKWNYALLVPMLGLAAFRWIWSKESEKEITQAKTEYTQKVSNIEKDLETKYRDIISENRRTVAHLEIELEKEQNRTLSYRRALVSQSQKLVEERKLMEQEKVRLMQEMQVVQQSGTAGALYSSYLGKEEQWRIKAKSLLREFEDDLKERQNIYCSLMVPKARRLELEKKMLIKAATDPVAVELDVQDGLNDIFKHDTHCAVLMNTNKSQNGKLMWVYLRYWELAVELKKLKHVEASMLGKKEM
ncbi:coiled-coil domain-containing protein 127 [Spea bombifrons]|uniref:coiled-coil domain-containing protein 127 n=1 Tax=Spea bombifrons TaxID=233779 RepID=UPI00234ABF1A|nr:coiled-coil domain-containing protein 127 [Spea bombifrons]XP_053322729.1 coiled-coil domain-containing protein 127 [Spea bombifrons]XP_053322730.1 coiled-coil domain-containing protein 127 [Spea bombifrons]XP_053322731.1 coiled-coil domain-containing protein 127 [Spea bombifrons]XP_053322732.1 coiled-coil domain-containing protein 127 [Spea bombifrons]